MMFGRTIDEDLFRLVTFLNSGEEFELADDLDPAALSPPPLELGTNRLSFAGKPVPDGKASGEDFQLLKRPADRIGGKDVKRSLALPDGLRNQSAPEGDGLGRMAELQIGLSHGTCGFQKQGGKGQRTEGRKA